MLLRDKVAAALAEVGADRHWAYDAMSPHDDPAFIWRGPTMLDDDGWTLLWQAFGVSGGGGGGWKVPCLACYLDGDSFSDYQNGIDRCDIGWPSRDCGRDREQAHNGGPT